MIGPTAFTNLKSILLAALMALVWAPVAVRAAEPSLGNLRQVEMLQRTLADVADTVRPSVVAIRTERHFDNPESDSVLPDNVNDNLSRRLFPAVGSGVVIDPDGLILTNEHVIQDALLEDITCVLSNGQVVPVLEVTSDPRSDLAVLRVDAKNLKAIRMGDVADVRQGHFVIVMGNPFGTASDNGGRPAMSFGVVSALGQELSRQLDPLGERYYGNLIQTDARINPGNSGGPLLNIRGELIGINTAISTRSGASEGIGYAISIDKRTREIIARLARGEQVEYGYLGVDLDVPTAYERALAGAPSSGGALVREVRPGTPAATAGLQSGDIIMEYDDEPVQSRDHLVRVVGASRPGVEVSMLVYRDKQSLRLRVRPDRRPTELRVAGAAAPFSWRGMKLAELSPATRRAHKIADEVDGLLVLEVDPNGPAQKAGIRTGQVLRQVGDVPINSLKRLRDIAPSLSGSLKVIVTGARQNAQVVTLP
ncbi:MAG TPA: trypsin-like peptidase domain-containing protein [Phycisphaerae bacterium]|jgi:serine protease Do|nr:PDZ domain-containing protein [Phycisphaerae bacterium]HOB73082.1 trypsin-like peptidase domain-containing protein [Phycisphaerae bacterium]HOJ54037.1 trypsin-like peptidase domain-containing protein [Phycisphaerae bacterium]HOL26448.1 trypsin-like peptidase domain-containing protein [Phycisphaerae bacterium]HPP20427.1 trypsin-like peptidase domain-containing protein [Phycisphaerae bacterium]